MSEEDVAVTIITTPEATGPTVDWNALNAGEIYDRLTQKGARLGTQANKMIRLLKKDKYLSEGFANVVGKTKPERELQRAAWVSMPTEALDKLRAAMHKFANGVSDDEDGNPLDAGDIPKNLRARAWHLADDPQSVGYLEVIFGGVSKKERRAQLDDKATRSEAQWAHVCSEFFNNESWKPDNPFQDTRLLEIDPSKPPEEPYQPEVLRKFFSAMRTQYSIFNDRYHRSGHLEEGDGDGDDDFFDNFARGDTVYLYAHKLFQGQPPKFCTRDISINQQSDVGVGDASIVSNITETPAGTGKRKYVDLTKEDYQEIFQPSDAETKRDESIERYFTTSERFLAMTQLENAINANSFQLLPEEAKEALLQKYSKLVIEYSKI
mmetsp:Transcript_1450/g.2372  ORF Transcript_1450/g.2372 Transcript_1450/m.2372 type:complete len:379 (+) Transcript_1450:66-1202(+)|eukprot:CAMPEP_0174967278 /NCGR_PEP_ID=MMETSP0004_2-20121128/7497_1 /TAXON_ID=420556 /ORGANISM="Ochromonas sp., Strain CCMP1393" /LENGTH=378 /DNA_ID=CAMNT_0016216397 /DNA_START=29 /DNA_END=1165 /DNA_ORIENTATION=-